MGWTVELTVSAERDLGRLDPPAARRILKFLRERISGSEDPRRLGHALRGPKLGSLWRYRIGDYRLLCSLEDARCVVLALRAGHRRHIYRG
ncbi:MAG: type II toxin-antitoxin system RelE family toxin [Terriglobales bacterium]